MRGVLRTSAVSIASSAASENEDAMVVSEDAVVVVDGAGLPSTMRAGCSHTVAWFATEIAAGFHAALVARVGTMSEALAVAIERVAGSHASSCDLDAGSPSATVAAWRLAGSRLEYLVLCDASLILVDERGRATGVTDPRLEHLVDATAAELVREGDRVTAAAARTAARVRVERLRNREGGFWCVNSDPLAAAHAVTGTAGLDGLAGVIACSDGATRAYDLLSTHTLDQFATACVSGRIEPVAAAVRDAEDRQAFALQGEGHKPHDDLTIVVAVRR